MNLHLASNNEMLAYYLIFTLDAAILVHLYNNRVDIYVLQWTSMNVFSQCCSDNISRERFYFL